MTCVLSTGERVAGDAGIKHPVPTALAGVSVEYYSKLERRALGGVSASVLDALARALQLDDAERAHLFHLAHAADGTSAGMRPRRRPGKRGTPRPGLQWVLEKFTAPFQLVLAAPAGARGPLEVQQGLQPVGADQTDEEREDGLPEPLVGARPEHEAVRSTAGLFDRSTPDAPGSGTGRQGAAIDQACRLLRLPTIRAQYGRPPHPRHLRLLDARAGGHTALR